MWRELVEEEEAEEGEEGRGGSSILLVLEGSVVSG
jgi:hypothetical protein